ncbi:MAG: metalloregulator ArsR/SmtB family transcription factor [Pseudomonadota bacterium]
MDSNELDLVFGALSDATRRGILAQLAAGETNVSALAAPYDISQPAVSKHLRVLEKAGLIRREKRGRENFVAVTPGPAQNAADWVSHYTRLWTAQFDAVDAYLKKTREPKK